MNLILNGIICAIKKLFELRDQPVIRTVNWYTILGLTLNFCSYLSG